MLTQITKREGTIYRVPRGQTPIIEIDTAAGAYITDVTLTNRDQWTRGVREYERKTCDWTWSCFVVHPLGETRLEEIEASILPRGLTVVT